MLSWPTCSNLSFLYLSSVLSGYFKPVRIWSHRRIRMVMGENIRLIWSRKKAFFKWTWNAWRPTKNTRPCTGLSAWIPLHIACHGLGRKPHVRCHWKLLSEAHRKARCTDDIWQLGLIFLLQWPTCPKSGQASTHIVHQELSCQTHLSKAVTRTFNEQSTFLCGQECFNHENIQKSRY